MIDDLHHLFLAPRMKQDGVCVAGTPRKHDRGERREVSLLGLLDTPLADVGAEESLRQRPFGIFDHKVHGQDRSGLCAFIGDRERNRKSFKVAVLVGEA